MKSLNRIAERFPSIYKTWDENSVIYKLLSSLAKGFEESQKDVRRILRSHWIDTAHGGDLDRLGAIFNLSRSTGQSDTEYRDRIKNAIQEFRGGGTISAVMASVKSLLEITDEKEVELIENPPQKMRVEKIVRAGDVWPMTSQSIHDVKPAITVKVVEEEAEASNPALRNLGTGELIRFSGTLKPGQELLIREGKASLDERDVTAKLTTVEAPLVEKEVLPVLTYDLSERAQTPDVPTLTRSISEWQYTEALRERIGVFDSARFDDGIFAVGIPEMSINFEWTAHPPASFEVRIRKSALTRSGVDEERIQRLVDSIKATGVTANVKIKK